MTRKFFWLVVCFSLFFTACQKAPQITVNTPATIDLSADGSSGTITFTANRDWTISCSDSWIHVSPLSGEKSKDAVTVTVHCDANTTYDDRTATVTIRAEDALQTVTIKQPQNLGIILPTQSYELASDAKSIDVEVKANVEYTVDISCNWIKQAGTKALTSKTLTFSIEENETYDARSATITIKPQNATVQEQIISVKQAQKDALIVKDTSFDMPYGGGEIEVKVEANVSFDVKPNVDWIHYVETKALSGSTVRLKVDENPTYSAREGKIEIKQKNGTLSHTLTVKQAGRVAVTSIELNKTSLTLKEGESETLTAMVKPDNATDKTVTWSTSDASVAEIDNTGKVTANDEGTATITARAGEAYTTCSVTVDNTTVLNGNLSNACFIIAQKGEYKILCSNDVSNGANSAFVLWNENGKDDIINLALQGDYVYFEKPSFKKGNAVVSLAKDGIIVRSWHLWSTDEPKFIDGIMDRNLGATSTEPNNEDAYGLMYSYGSPFPFPGAKYKDWTLTSEPSVPDGWYVAPGYGFYAESKMPTESTPMLYCTSADKYGNSIFWRNSSKYSPCPQGTSVLRQSKLQDIIGYEPSFNGLNGVRLDSGLFIPAAGRQRTQQEKGVRDVGVWGSYWGIGIYNNAAVDACACWFYEGFSKATSYYEGNTLHSIRCCK